MWANPPRAARVLLACHSQASDRTPRARAGLGHTVTPPFAKSKDSALAHCKPPSAQKDSFSFAKRRKKNAFRFPAKGLSVCYPGLADSKGCISRCNPKLKGDQTMSTEPKLDIYSRVTNKILADLEQGVRPWVKPWSSGHAAGRIGRPLRHTGQPYQGVNILLLWGSAVENGFSAPFWMTFKQAHELGAHVRKGEKGSLVVYANTVTKTEKNEETGEESERDIPFLKGYTVFNVEQIEDLPAHYYAKPSGPEAPEAERNEAFDLFFKNTRADIRHGGDRAFYSTVADYVKMPPFSAFRDPESYYATLAHEMTHWTSHENRLDRDLVSKGGYAKEELVAELGAAFLCADLGITPEVREDHASYIKHWLKVLKDDKRFIFRAAAHAQHAVNHLQRYQQTQEEAGEQAA